VAFDARGSVGGFVEGNGVNGSACRRDKECDESEAGKNAEHEPAAAAIDGSELRTRAMQKQIHRPSNGLVPGPLIRTGAAKLERPEPAGWNRSVGPLNRD
jgi:hypothetical protein